MLTWFKRWLRIDSETIQERIESYYMSVDIVIDHTLSLKCLV